jgi:NAD(P)H-nitrite reductase large subunit
MRHVIIGNSVTAVGAIEAIREHDAESPITVVADEPHHVYSRPLISYLLGGLVDESRMYYRPPDFYERFHVETMLGTKVERVVPQEHRLSLAGGGTLAYDQLLIATGGKPFVPPVPGADLEGVFTFTCWDDARRMARYIEDRDVESALVVGGGLIGLKTTEGLMARDIHVTVVELADRILNVSFDQTASRIAESVLRREGTEIKTGITVECIIGRNDKVDHAVLSDQERVDCDLAIFAIGVRPNTEIIPDDSAIDVNRGVLVNQHMRTSVADVYAAGDCVETNNILLDVVHPIAIWPNAYRQGYVAGCNMAGVEKTFEGGFPMNSVEVCGLPTISVGLTDPQEDLDDYAVMEKYDRKNLTYRKLVLRDHRLVGAICVGDIGRAGIYTGLIRDQADVSPFKDHLLSGDFGLISLPQAYRKHMVVGEGIEV